MTVTVSPAALTGSVRIPGSKSHTIRALVIATLAEGESSIRAPLWSGDTTSCIEACRLLGANITTTGEEAITVRGTGGELTVPENVIDVGNSGTTLYFLTAVAGLVSSGWCVFTGDSQIRNRPVAPLLAALRDLGAESFTTRGGDAAPLVIRGRLTGGRTSIECPTSQYLSALLLALPAASEDSRITVPLLNERPYVEMTLRWLDEQNIQYSRNGYDEFRIAGGQRYRSFQKRVPGDYSSATFLFCAAAITGSTISVTGLDPTDSQGDKEVLSILSDMGCTVEQSADAVTVSGRKLRGGRFDLNAIPDSLPALAATACFADEEVILENVPQARLKETDRIAVMAEELERLGARIEETADGMIVRPSRVTGGRVSSHADHRVAMALAIAGLGAESPVKIDGGEAASITFPRFYDALAQLGASF